ncbi:MAG TPA: hypothetical protein VJM08_00140 [Anaerolineales bacterium]|nr:hypothetical protein [Anaerolineales bacterium]
MKINRILIGIIIALCTAVFPVHASDNIVSSIVKAPVVADGDIAGAATDLVINLDTSLDPAVPGRMLLAGRTIKVTLPKEFINTGSTPLQDVFSSPTCVPGNLQCSTAVLLQGWPQYPILPRVPPVPPGTGTPRYTLSLEGANTIVFTALADVGPGSPLAGPGIKQIHLILNGFLNPSRTGFYPITVEAETGPNGEFEFGIGKIHIRPRMKPSINITSAFNPGAPNTIYQTTSPGALTPLPYDFLLWDRNGDPFEGVVVEMRNPSEHDDDRFEEDDAEMKNRRFALLKQGERVVGSIKIKMPPNATGQEVYTEAASSVINAPITGVPTARLRVFFRAGSASGTYVVTFSLKDGNEVQMYVEVE